MATKKLTITLSEEALSKLEFQAKALDITSNTFVKQIAMNYINNNEFIFFSKEQLQILQDFSYKQSQLINTLRKIDEEYLKKGVQFPTEKLLDFFKSYHNQFKHCIERLSSADN